MRALLALAAALVLGLPLSASAQQCEFPGVLVVLDRSISMLGTIGGVTKWDIARGALDGMLQTYSNAAQFGLMIYPGPSGSGANGIEGPVGACRQNMTDVGCTPLAPRCTTGEVVVDIAANTRQAILDATVFPQGLSNSYTPTWQSLAAAREYPRLAQPGRRNFVVLITDGWQCCGLFNGGNSCEPENRNFVVEQVEGLVDQDVTTFVVGFGGLVDVQTLQRAATAGGAPRPGCNPAVDAPAGSRCYYQADSAQQLQGMLDDIVQRIAVELCDGLDNDCDGRLDEGLNRACNSACGAGQERCVNGRFLDCNAPTPVAETCNGADDDCDGRTDENLTRGCQNECGVGQERCVNGAFAACDAPVPVAEVCDGIDNNCDGTADEGCDCQPGDTRACGEDRGSCRPGQQTCQANGTWGACAGGVGPVAETCNGRDDDCDGRADENVTRACTSECGGGVETCENGQFVDCNAPRPAPSEICGNGLDDDCDGQPDDGCECTDGQEQTCGRERGECVPGRQLCAGGQWGDCTGAVPGTDETCDGLDNDCDGRIDEGDLCGAGEYCACGGCNQPCQNNECTRGLMCTFGYCVEDNCPDGQICAEGQCVPGDDPGAGGNGGNGAEGGFGGSGASSGGADQGTGSDLGTVIAGSGASAGCSCDVNDSNHSAPAGALGLLALLGLRRRRR